MVAMDGIIFTTFAFLLLLPLTNAIVPCSNTESEAMYHGRAHWTIPDDYLTYNNSDLISCSILCRKDSNCKSFAFADESCTLYDMEIGKDTRRLVRSVTSVHFDGMVNPSKTQSYFGACSMGNQCENGATCVNDCSERGYSCVCVKRFRGVNCENGITDTLVLQATIPVGYPGRIEYFRFNGNLYIVSLSYGPTDGVHIFKYDVAASTYEEIQFIVESLIWRVFVFTIGNDIYVSLGKYYSTDPVYTYRFNPQTEQFENPFTYDCGKCTVTFFQDSRGDRHWMISRYQNNDKVTSSTIYSFSKTGEVGTQFTEDIETYGVEHSCLFEMNNVNYLLILNTVNDNSDLKNTMLYRQPHDYGRPQTASVFAIFILSEGTWKLVYKAVSGVNNIDLYSLWSTAGSRNENNSQAMKLDDTFRDHYRSSLIDSWDNVSKVKVAFYDKGKSQLALVFDAVGSTNLDWFTKDRLMNYPWSDLHSKTPAVFAITDPSITGRHWIIADFLETCLTDSMWMMVTTHEGCNFERTEPRPMFMYSNKKTSMTFNSDVFLDCYLDNGAERALSDYILTSPGVTAWDCLDLCRGLDFKYAGVDILNTACYCGNSGYDSGGTTDCSGRTASDATLMMKTVMPWKLHQEFSSPNKPRHAEYFEDNGHSYLIIQSMSNSDERPRYTSVFKWSTATDEFEQHQNIDIPFTVYHFDVLKVYDQLYLILTPFSADVPDGYRQQVMFYRFEGNYFIKDFELTSCRSCGWNHFIEDNQLYIIQGNYYSSPCTTYDTNGNLKIYKWT